jgi:hypothetical protein
VSYDTKDVANSGGNGVNEVGYLQYDVVILNDGMLGKAGRPQSGNLKLSIIDYSGPVSLGHL